MDKRMRSLTLALSAAAFVLALIALVAALAGGSGSKDVQFVVYLGTNDKDTGEMPMSRQDAHTMAEEILLRHFGGYTIQEADGGWIDDGVVCQEFTLVIYLSDTTLDKVHAAAKDLITAFNQSTVLIQQNSTVTEFYSGE